jgi:hypothetical protein
MMFRLAPANDGDDFAWALEGLPRWRLDSLCSRLEQSRRLYCGPWGKPAEKLFRLKGPRKSGMGKTAGSCCPLTTNQ